MLSCADKDLMEKFLYASLNRTLCKEYWTSDIVPQGVAVFKRHHNGRVEYMFTKDDKFNMKRDDINDLRGLARTYSPDDYLGVVFVMHSEAVKIVSKHSKHPY